MIRSHNQERARAWLIAEFGQDVPGWNEHLAAEFDAVERPLLERIDVLEHANVLEHRRAERLNAEAIAPATAFVMAWKSAAPAPEEP